MLSGKITDLEQIQLIRTQSVRERILILENFQKIKIWRVMENLFQNLTQNESFNSIFATYNVYNTKACILKESKRNVNFWMETTFQNFESVQFC